MVNFNGTLRSEEEPFLTHANRGLHYGDALFETLRAVNGKLFFWEDHYFRLMASMRILRMDIPMEFTMEYLETEILKTVDANAHSAKARVKLLVFRKSGGLYTPTDNGVQFIITVGHLEHPFYILEDSPYEVELFKDYYINADMLSNLKTTNKIINVVAGVYAQENGYDNCLLLNQKKQVVEAINGNLFMVVGKTIKTPPLADGCLDGIARKKLITLLQGIEGYELEEASISPFELQKADELFITNAIHGIRPITKYRKKRFITETAKNLIGKLNATARLA